MIFPSLGNSFSKPHKKEPLALKEYTQIFELFFITVYIKQKNGQSINSYKRISKL